MTNSSMTFYAYISTIKLKWFLFQDLHIAEFSLGIVIDTAQYRKSIMLVLKQNLYFDFRIRKYSFN
jgi:hypothetical protein